MLDESVLTVNSVLCKTSIFLEFNVWLFEAALRGAAIAITAAAGVKDRVASAFQNWIYITQRNVMYVMYVMADKHNTKWYLNAMQSDNMMM